MRLILLLLLLTSPLLSAEKATITLKNGKEYYGTVVRYTEKSISIEIDSVDGLIITAKYETLDKISCGGMTISESIMRSDIATLLHDFEPAATEVIQPESSKPAVRPAPKRRKLPAGFSSCYDDNRLAYHMKHINTMSDSAFNYLIYYLDQCYTEMETMGIIQNPCHNRVYKQLHNSPKETLSNRELNVLQKLREQCFNFQEDIEWSLNLCEDPVYTDLLSRSSKKLSFKEALYLEQVHHDCEELKDDLDDDYRDYWLTRYAMFHDTVSAIFDPPTNPKPFQTAGGVLLVPGIALPIIGGSLRAQNRESEFGNGFKRILGSFFIIMGIACDVTALTMLSLGSSKQQELNKYNQLKMEYEQYKKVSMREFSINFNYEF